MKYHVNNWTSRPSWTSPVYLEADRKCEKFLGNDRKRMTYRKTKNRMSTIRGNSKIKKKTMSFDFYFRSCRSFFGLALHKNCRIFCTLPVQYSVLILHPKYYKILHWCVLSDWLIFFERVISARFLITPRFDKPPTFYFLMRSVPPQIH